MTDEQWATLTNYLTLPAAARSAIENELDIYRRFAEAEAQSSRPSKTRTNLDRAAELASKLLQVIERFGPDEHRALGSVGTGATRRPEALGHLAE